MLKKNLTTYHAKRDFAKTPEPKGAKASKGNIFVVQKHAASHLHYDFRLEVNGVLKSWAVPKGISKTINEKRLAIQTEDHPIEYAHFAGIIPEGNYGAGKVEIWDEGEYEVVRYLGKVKSMSTALHEGKIKIKLNGKKLKGTYALVHTHMHGDEKNNQWLLFRIAASGPDYE
jgi:bifunctional non-homologous end joining protein LigD